MAGLESEPAQPSVEVVPDGDSTLIKIVGELDLATVGGVELLLDPLMQSPPELIVFEMAGVTFMDSSGIALLLRIAEKVPSVAVRDPSDSVKMVIRATGLADVLRIES